MNRVAAFSAAFSFTAFAVGESVTHTVNDTVLTSCAPTTVLVTLETNADVLVTVQTADDTP